ncbi:MAG: acyltransferase family protein [Christensenellaceae bacterium]
MEINTELNPTPHSERNHGIELLRIFAMLLAAVLHILKKGGVITASEGNLAAYSTVWLLEAAAYCAVNCYALISGYVGYSDRPKPLRLARCIELWLQVVFYSVIITTVYCIAGVGSVGVSDFADAFLPVTSKQYWYFTAYIGMFFFIPLLNALVRRLNRRALVSLCIMLIAVFSLYDTFASFWKKDPLALVGGHSPLWLGVLYIFGAAMKKLRVPESMSSKKALLIYASAAVFALFKITGDRLLRFVREPFVRTPPHGAALRRCAVSRFARFKPGRKLTVLFCLHPPHSRLLHVSPLCSNTLSAIVSPLSGASVPLSRSPCLPRQELSWLSDLRRTKCAYCFLKPWVFRSCAEKPKNPYAGCGCMLLMLLQTGNNQTAA